MKPRYALLAALATSCLVALAAAPDKLPPAWTITGTNAASFVGGVDRSVGMNGAKFIRNVSGDSNVWASLAQQISAENYRNQRIRFSARIKTENVTNWAGLWMRVDRAGGNVAAFYNSIDKPIKGSNDWQQRSVVLDVPADAESIAFGVIDSGNGQVWIDGVSFQPVAMDVPVDHMPKPRVPKLSTAPSL